MFSCDVSTVREMEAQRMLERGSRKCHVRRLTRRRINRRPEEFRGAENQSQDNGPSPSAPGASTDPMPVGLKGPDQEDVKKACVTGGNP